MFNAILCCNGSLLVVYGFMGRACVCTPACMLISQQLNILQIDTSDQRVQPSAINLRVARAPKASLIDNLAHL